MRTNATKVIEVTDVKPEAFRLMLHFIYTTNFNGLNQENMFDVLHAAHKYHISDLIDACADCPILDIDNVLYTLEKAELYAVKGLIYRCWGFIDQNANAVLENDKFLEIDQAFLCDLFAEDDLILKNGEFDIWNAAINWADAQCRKRNIEITSDNRRIVLGPALFKIRFPLIQKDQFASIIVPTKILAEGEIIGILFYNAHSINGIPSEYVLKFPSERRNLAEDEDDGDL